MVATLPNIDTAKLKSTAAGRWGEIIPALCPVDASVLDGQPHPCPKCGGTDRFRFIDTDAGACLCNQCFSEKNGDGIAAVGWLLDKDFRTTTKLIASHLGMPEATNGNGAKQVDFGAKMRLRDRPTSTDGQSSYAKSLNSFATAKPPITIDTIGAAGGRLCFWPREARENFSCIAFPAQRTNTGNITGWILYRTDGSDFPAIPNGPGQRKTHMLGGSKDGWVIIGGWDALKNAETVVKVEGIPDALAIQPKLPDGVVAITNIAGCKSTKLPLGEVREVTPTRPTRVRTRPRTRTRAILREWELPPSPPLPPSLTMRHRHHTKRPTAATGFTTNPMAAIR